MFRIARELTESQRAVMALAGFRANEHLGSV